MNILHSMIEKFLQMKGVQPKAAWALRKFICEDWKRNPVPIKKKIWAYKRGFLSSRIDLYGLNEKNYKKYLSDLDYSRNHPYNNHFDIWINDKLTLKYILSGLRKDIMPEYYIYIENDGSYSYLMDFPKDLSHGDDAIVNLLRLKPLALKPNRGSGGAGFIKLEINDNAYVANGKILDSLDFSKMIRNLKGYLVSEYCIQHHELNKVFTDTVCTLRVIAFKNPRLSMFEKANHSIIVSYARFGTKKSGGASNLSSGGVGIGFDFETGEFGNSFYRYKNYKIYGDHEMVMSHHPDTGYVLSGERLPLIEEVKKTVYDICNYLSSLDYFGIDLMVTEKGIKICEINSKPALNYEQVMCGAVNMNENAYDFFHKRKRK